MTDGKRDGLSPLKPYPKYGDNGIEKDIVFDTDKTSTTFGCPYYFTKQHKVQERNRFLYKLVNDLETDSIASASRSVSSYSTLSYRSNFADYYWPMPLSFADVNEEAGAPKENPPRTYGFVQHRPPFEKRNAIVRDCGAMLKVANDRLLPGERKLARLLKEGKKEYHPKVP